MYLLVMRTLIVLDVYIVKFEQKNYSFKKKDSSLTGFKISPILLQFTRANFYLSNVASIRFSTFKNVVLDENILKIGGKKLLENFFMSRIQNKIYFTRKLCNFYLRNVDSIRFSILKNIVLDTKNV